MDAFRRAIPIRYIITKTVLPLPRTKTIMKWIASLLLIAIVAFALFAKVPTAQATFKGGPVVTPTVNPSATPVSK